jgi:hypothetical protein
MSGTPSLSTKPQKTADFTEAMLRLAAVHADELREAFHKTAAARRDAASWLRLEEVCVSMLDRRRATVAGRRFVREPHWLLRDGRSERAFEALLNRSCEGERAEAYVKAVDELISNTAHWMFLFDAPVAAYWRHASLVWLSLWHAALSSDVPAAEAAKSLGLTVKRKSGAGHGQERPEVRTIRRFASLGLNIWKKGAGAF